MKIKTFKAKGLILFSFLLLIFAVIYGCNDDMTNTTPTYPYNFSVWNYSDDHYFLDTVYKESFLDYYNNTSISAHTDSLRVDDQSFEVWAQTDLSTIGYRRAAAYIDLPELPVSGHYNDSFKVPTNLIQGVNIFGLVTKLSESQYELNNYAGYISLRIELHENYFVGVAYKRQASGKQFGTISTDTNVAPTDTLVLKMIKVVNLIPGDSIAWELKLKNIYQLPTKNVSANGFVLNINYIVSETFKGINLPIITVLGLDKYTNGRSGPPDGNFDFLPGLTIDQEEGWIIFPTLKPFLDDLKYYSPPIDSSYWYPEIYTKLKIESSSAPNANKYLINGFLTN
ncbi:MAG: hypothetical protein ABI840_03375 [bacterium]